MDKKHFIKRQFWCFRLKQSLIFRLLLIFILFFSFGCATILKPNHTIDTTYVDDDSYVKTLKDRSGKTILDVSVKYIGTSPEKPVPDYVSGVWEKKDTDFWNLIFSNKSDSDIQLLKWEYIESGPLAVKQEDKKIINRKMGQEGIKSILGDNIILPNSELMQKDSLMVRGDEGSRLMLKEITLKHGGKTYIISIEQNTKG
ncbi:hypothetical protein N9174_02220 [bacterium]|nr:hypothetical protein [bacterium]